MTQAIFNKPFLISAKIVLPAVILIFLVGKAVCEPAESILLVANPPAKDSPEYAKLLQVAGQPPTRRLVLTNCEVWKVSRKSVSPLEKVAIENGSVVTKLGKEWNSVFLQKKDHANMSQSQVKILNDAKSSRVAANAMVMEAPEPNVTEYVLTNAQYSKTADGTPSEITLPLREGMMVTAQRSTVTLKKDRYVWRGFINSRKNSITVMWWPSGRMSGTIRYGGRIYVIKHIGGRLHSVIEMVPGLMPPEHAVMSETAKNKMNMSALENAPKQSQGSQKSVQPDKSNKIDPENVKIDVLVAYTRKVAEKYTNVKSDLILLAIEDANHSFRKSGIENVTLRVAHTALVDYTETGTHFDHLYSLLVSSDGVLDEVQSLRNKHHADVAVLIVDDPKGCGLAAKINADEKRAFAVVHHECALLNYSLAHEIGHLIGARHDVSIDSNNKPFSYGHGYIHETKWRTMMSYKDNCNDCPRIPRWSNPNVKVDGVPAGSTTSNNARVIREQAARVAAFR